MPLLLSCGLAQQVFCADPPAGKVVWWGRDFIPRTPYSEHTNGVIESGNEILSNVVAVAARSSQALALKSDGTVFGFGDNFRGGNDVPAGLSNVVSIAVEGNSCWAIKRDSTVARWGNELSDQDDARIVAGLSNVVSITWAGYRSYLVLKNDGTVLGFRLDDGGLPNGSSTEPAVRPVRVQGQVLSNVVALASMGYMGYTPLVLKNDGTVFCLGYQTPGAPPAEPRYEVHGDVIYEYLGGESAKLPYQYTSADPVKVDGKALSNVVAITGGSECGLVLKSNGTVVAWGNNNDGETAVPAGLSNVIAIAGSGLALKRDGTVVAWGGTELGLPPVPAGLSNVAAIASGGSFGLALTTGSVPSSVFIQPHGRLEEMEREADVIFKGRVLSSTAITNTSFPYWGKAHATKFRLISVLKGNVETNEPVFWHNTSGPDAWGGGSPPSWHQFETGQSYLVFAGRLDKPDYLYSPPADATNRPNEFRQLCRDGVMRTLDARPVTTTHMKEAHWFELNLLLNDTNPSNQLYAVTVLDRMSLGDEGDWRWTRSDDFKREAVLKAVLPLVTNGNEQVAVSAIGCFEVGGSHVDLFGDLGGWLGGWMPIVRGCSGVGPERIVRVSPYANALVAVANSSSSSLRRVAAIAALSCTRFAVVSNSLPRWLADPAANVRAQAVLLLPDFPGELCERSLRARAADASPVVRAAVADAIGIGKIEALLPTLGALFQAPVGPTNPVVPPTHKGLQGDGYFVEMNADDIHKSAGYALLKFDLEHVGEFLKANLSDEGFGLSFIRKLAQNGAEPYLPLLTKELKTHTAGSEKEAAANGFHWPLSYWLTGNYGWAWDTLLGYVSAQTREALADPQMAPMLDALQIADDPGDARTRSLYGFFLDKGLIERAIELRRGITRRTEDKAIDKASFNFPSLLKAFDEIDEKHPLKPGLGR